MDEDVDDKDGNSMDALKASMESGAMSLDERLVDMGLDPAEYKEYAHAGDPQWEEPRGTWQDG